VRQDFPCPLEASTSIQQSQNPCIRPVPFRRTGFIVLPVRRRARWGCAGYAVRQTALARHQVRSFPGPKIRTCGTRLLALTYEVMIQFGFFACLKMDSSQTLACSLTLSVFTTNSCPRPADLPRMTLS